VADKRTALEIVVETIDKATGGLKKIAGAISAIGILTAPISLIGEKLKGLGKASGISEVAEGFKGVGSAVAGVLTKVALIGGAIAAATAGVFALIHGFDELGDQAKALGVSADFVAQIRYAAERSGAPVDALNNGLKTMSQLIGEAKAGGGELVGFLGIVSPKLLKQIKTAKNNEEAFMLLAKAAAKIEDPAKRAVFAQKTLGDSVLAPLLAKGAKGIEELRHQYLELAGSQEAAVKAAAPVDDAMKDLKAATDGIKAALVAGLGPALQQLVEEMKAWFAENRERIGEWALMIGKKLPGAIHEFVDTALEAIDDVQAFVEGIGGIKVVAIAVAAVINGPLILAIGKFAIALLTTPIGWILLGLAALVAAVVAVIKNWDKIAGFFKWLWGVVVDAFGAAWDFIGNLVRTVIGAAAGAVVATWRAVGSFFVGLWDGITGVFQRAWDFISSIVDKVMGAVNAVKDAAAYINPFAGDGAFTTVTRSLIPKEALGAALGAGGARAQQSEAKVKIELTNAPRGTRVTSDPRNTADVSTSVGYLMGFGS
jgi:phage-related minor tail protein